MRAARFLPFLLGALLPACSDNNDETDQSPPAAPDQAEVDQSPRPPVASHQETEVFFRCTDGTEFIVTFGDQSATLTYEDAEHELQQQPAGSGTRYADGVFELITKGGQAALITEEVTRDCTRLEEERVSVPGADQASLERPAAGAAEPE